MTRQDRSRVEGRAQLAALSLTRLKKNFIFLRFLDNDTVLPVTRHVTHSFGFYFLFVFSIDYRLRLTQRLTETYAYYPCYRLR